MLDTLLRRPKPNPIDLASSLRLPAVPPDLASAHAAYDAARRATDAARQRRNALGESLPYDGEQREQAKKDQAAADAAIANATAAELEARGEKDRLAEAFAAETRASLAEALDAYESAVAARLDELDTLLSLGIALDGAARSTGVDLQRKAVRGSGHLKGLLKMPRNVIDGWRR